MAIDSIIFTCVRVDCWLPLLPALLVTYNSLGVDAVESLHDTGREPMLLRWAGSTQLEPNHVARQIVEGLYIIEMKCSYVPYPLID